MGFDASVNKLSIEAVDSILKYYSVGVELERIQKGENQNTQKRNSICQFIKQNKKDIAQELVNSNGLENLGVAYDIVEKYLKKHAYHGYTPEQTGVTAPSFYDTRTGHKYIRTQVGTYDEYTKKGRFFKTVQPVLPLLTKSMNVYAISSNNYILYKKQALDNSSYQFLPGSENHPNGWMTEKLVTSLK